MFFNKTLTFESIKYTYMRCIFVQAITLKIKINIMTTQEINTNIARLEKEVKNLYANKGYIENCKNTLEWYKSLIK